MLQDIIKMDLKTILTTLPNVHINSYKEMVEVWRLTMEVQGSYGI